MTTTRMYGIWLDGELVKCKRHANHPYTVPETYVIGSYGDIPWLVEESDTARAVLESDYQSPDWYNADVNHPFVDKDLTGGRVVEVVTTVEIKEYYDGKR